VAIVDLADRLQIMSGDSLFVLTQKSLN